MITRIWRLIKSFFASLTSSSPLQEPVLPQTETTVNPPEKQAEKDETTEDHHHTTIPDLPDDQVSTPEQPSPGPSPRVKFASLPANNGDTLLIGFEDTEGKSHYIWIDGGLVKSYQNYHKDFLRQMYDAKVLIDLMVITHVDQDHIGGILAFCNDASIPKDWISRFWFNSGVLLNTFFNQPPDPSRTIALPDTGDKSRSLAQGISLEGFLEKNGSWHTQPIMKGQVHELTGAKISILSPSQEGLAKLNREWQEELESTRAVVSYDYDQSLEDLAAKKEDPDTSIPNGSSIACLFEYGGVTMLLLGDAHGPVVGESLRELGYSPENRLKADVVKLSHHSSKASNTHEMLDLVDGKYYIISTDGSRHGLPNKEAMARIILHPQRDKSRELVFVFNHDNETLRSIFTEAEQQAHNFSLIFPEPGKQGVELNWGGN
ncbi:MAG: MBL fold metallo-hydrolase [Bacteroidia bacterium]